MARTRTHSDEQILTAVRDLLLSGGERGVTTAAVSRRSGAPTGTLYHRFGSRAAMVAELWVRTIGDFHDVLLAAVEPVEPGLPRALVAAGTVVDFAAERPEDARLMLIASREELRADPGLPPALADSLEHLNDPADALARRLARELYGRVSAAGLDRVTIGAFGVPYTAVRRSLLQGRDPSRLRPLVLNAARAVLESE